MTRPLLRITAHPSSWVAADARRSGRDAAIAATPSCRFCGLATAGWQEVFHCNDDHDDHSAGNTAISCPLCHLCQHLNRIDIDREAVLIWLPEMDQAALNILVRQIHLECVAAGVSPILDSPNRGLVGAAAQAPLAAYRALHERSSIAASRLDTCSPRELGALLYSMPRVDRARRIDMLGGLRLLSRGQIFSSGRDIYPEMLRDWAVTPVILA